MRDTYSDPVISYLLTGEQPKDEDAWWEILAFTTRTETVRAAWEDLREDLLPDWIAKRPGSRPWGWWEFDAPRSAPPEMPDWIRERMVVPRLRVGGTGAPSWEKWPAIVPWYSIGLPVCTEGVDPADPPIYETEAAYLDRLGLLAGGERERIPAEAWEPRVICSRETTPRSLGAEDSKDRRTGQ